MLKQLRARLRATQGAVKYKASPKWMICSDDVYAKLEILVRHPHPRGSKSVRGCRYYYEAGTKP